MVDSVQRTSKLLSYCYNLRINKVLLCEINRIRLLECITNFIDRFSIKGGQFLKISVISTNEA